MTFRIPNIASVVVYLSPSADRPLPAIVQRMVIADGEEMTADLTVFSSSGNTYAAVAVPYRGATPDAELPGLCWAWPDDDDDEDAD
jgi:hypothetical protein